MAIANAALGLFNTYGEVGRKDYTPYRATGVDLFALGILATLVKSVGQHRDF
ncbi:MAG: hypothetical protein M3Y27_11710 [Acidobacteriota bacterium]|nr:hypothetical protein [Acidobacteriota bacterium]